MPTPIVYGPHLYVCSNAGVVTCYEVKTGKQVYRERIGGESYTASPVAADGRLYFTSEQGEVRVVKAGAEFELLAVNDLGDVCMAPPAISGGVLFVRSQHFLFALGRNQPEKGGRVNAVPRLVKVFPTGFALAGGPALEVVIQAGHTYPIRCLAVSGDRK
jgi:hypothetical protein